MQTYFYDISTDPDMPGFVFVSLVSEAFWNREHCMDDQTPEELYEALESGGFAETMESVFELEGTPEQAEDILKSLGMRTDEGFSEFLKNLGG